nr:hypothetical protein [Leuven wasp-associated virus 4]
MKLEKIRKAAKIRFKALGPCRIANSLAIVATNPIAYKVGVHNNCQHNELVALCNRHLIDRGKNFDIDFFREKTRVYLKHISKFVVSIEPCSYSSIINEFVGGKRAMYQRARERIRQEGFNPKWAVVKMFVKPDKYPLDEVAGKPARAIQSRDPAYNLIIGKFLKPIEHYIYQTFGTFAKMRNNQERAADVIKMIEAFSNPIFINLDHSKFDSCCNANYLRFTHKIYRLFNRSKFLKYALNFKINNVGYTKGGIRYKVKGTRMSGDYDTGLGNSLINDYLLFTAFSHVKHRRYLDGDDSIIIIEKCDLGKIDFGIFSKMGFDSKIDIVTDPSRIEFCQSRLCLSPTPTFTRNPWRALSHLCVSTKVYPPKFWPALMESRLMCELAVSKGVPILEPIAKKLIRHITPYFEEGDKWMIKFGARQKEVTITDAERIAYAQCWDLNPEEQKLIESLVNTADLPFIYKHTKYFHGLKDKRIIAEYADDALQSTWETWHSMGASSSPGCFIWRQGRI